MSMDIIDLFQIVRLGEIDSFINQIAKADIDQVNEYNQNLLHESVANDRIRIGTLLIKKGINLDQKDVSGQTSLHHAALHNSYELAEKIIEYGGNLSIADSYGNEPLWTAVFNARGKYDIVKLYLKNGANPNHKNNSDRSPFDFAIQIKDPELIELLENYN